MLQVNVWNKSEAAQIRLDLSEGWNPTSNESECLGCLCNGSFTTTADIAVNRVYFHDPVSVLPAVKRSCHQYRKQPGGTIASMLLWLLQPSISSSFTANRVSLTSSTNSNNKSASCLEHCVSDYEMNRECSVLFFKHDQTNLKDKLRSVCSDIL